MTRVQHKFLTHKISVATETLIVGTFNPSAPENKADFFYASGRNFLWKILPAAFGLETLKDKPKSEKIAFAANKKIDFIDLISQVKVESSMEACRADSYIDKHVLEWREFKEELDNLPLLKRVCFSRKTYRDIPNMNRQLVNWERYMLTRDIQLQRIVSPARYCSDAKQFEWNAFLVS